MTLMASLVLTGTALVQAQPLPRCANPTQQRFQCANRIEGERQRIAQGRSIPKDQRQALVAQLKAQKATCGCTRYSDACQAAQQFTERPPNRNTPANLAKYPDCQPGRPATADRTAPHRRLWCLACRCRWPGLALLRHRPSRVASLGLMAGWLGPGHTG